jgi:hypothetical protein
MGVGVAAFVDAKNQANIELSGITSLNLYNKSLHCITVLVRDIFCGVFFIHNFNHCH